MEVLALILALHCRYPGHVHCLRGNHESVMMSRAYGFLTECRTRYSTRIYTAAVAVFNVLPVAAIVGGSIFAVHGGITPRLNSLEDIDTISRPAKLEADTLLADLIWGDPIVNAGVLGAQLLPPLPYKVRVCVRGVPRCSGPPRRSPACRRQPSQLVAASLLTGREGRT